MGDQTSSDSHGGILLQDLRYALRTLNRARGFALTVVLVTAIGVGANKATFSVADFRAATSLPGAKLAGTAVTATGNRSSPVTLRCWGAA